MKFVLIALVILIALKVIRRFRHGRRGVSRGCWRSYGGPRPSRGSTLMIGHLSQKLSLSSEQEAVLREQIKLLRARASSLDVPRDTRDRLAAVLRSESYDENLLGELFVAHDDALRTMRLEFVERLAALHDALDPMQRETLAQMLESGAVGNPYRGRF